MSCSFPWTVSLLLYREVFYSLSLYVQTGFQTGLTVDHPLHLYPEKWHWSELEAKIPPEEIQACPQAGYAEVGGQGTPAHATEGCELVYGGQCVIPGKDLARQDRCQYDQHVGE